MNEDRFKVREPGDPDYIEDRETRVAYNIASNILVSLYEPDLNPMLHEVSHKRILNAALRIAANQLDYVVDEYGEQLNDEDKAKVKEMIETGRKQGIKDFHEGLTHQNASVN